MHYYNEDYFVMLEDYEIDDPLTYEIGDYGYSHGPYMHNTALSQPIRFNIVIDEEEGETYSGKSPEDAIFIFPYGLILKREIMEENFLIFNPEDTIVHTAYIVSPDNKYFEGYVFIPTPIKPILWLDESSSDISAEKNGETRRIRHVATYSLNNQVLDKVEELQRCLFAWSASDIGISGAHLAHKTVVEALKHQKRNIRFIPLKDYDIAMALGGEDFPKSAI